MTRVTKPELQTNLNISLHALVELLQTGQLLIVLKRVERTSIYTDFPQSYSQNLGITPFPLKVSKSCEC
jgi:hypothetical protein